MCSFTLKKDIYLALNYGFNMNKAKYMHILVTDTAVREHVSTDAREERHICGAPMTLGSFEIELLRSQIQHL